MTRRPLRIASMTAVAAAALLATPARAEREPAFDASSKNGFVLIEVIPPPTVQPFTPVSIAIGPYDAAKGVVRRKAWNEDADTPTAEFAPLSPTTWLYDEIRPGPHAIKALYLQRHWGVCYDAGSVAFDVRPGEVLFLGSVDSGEDAAQMTARLPKELRLAATQTALVMGPTVPHQSLKFNAPTEADLARARAFLARRLPGVTAPVSIAAVRQVTFAHC